MNKALRIYGRCIEGLGMVLKSIGILLIFFIVLSIFVQVVSRYLFNRPHVWVEEFATYCFIWLVFIGAAFAHVKGRHIIVTTLIDSLSRRVQLVLSICANIAILTFLFSLIRFGFKQFATEMPLHSIALPVRLPRPLFYSLPFLIGTISMFIMTGYNLLLNLQEIFSLKNHTELEEVEK